MYGLATRIELYQAGRAVKVRVAPARANGVAVVGAIGSISIERTETGEYWNGISFSPTYAEMILSELSGNVHMGGLYEYEFNPLITTDYDSFNWKATFLGYGAWFGSFSMMTYQAFVSLWDRRFAVRKLSQLTRIRNNTVGD